MSRDDRYPVQAAHTSIRVLEAIETLDGAGVSELARHLDLSKSAVHKHLTTLAELGYLTREGDTYRFGLGFVRFGLQARNRLPLYGVTTPVVENLAEVTGYVASVVVPHDGWGICLVQASVGDDVSFAVTEGDRVPLHASAAGKTILAYLPDSAAEDLVDGGLSAVTEKTITDGDTLRRELQSVRDRRVAFAREELVVGWQSVASPVTDPQNRALGAVGVSGPVDSMTGKTLEEDVTGLVVSAAKSIENELL